MDKDIKRIVAKTFNIDESKVRLDQEMKDIALWDSLGHMNLISELEGHYNIEFEFEEMFEIVSVGSILEVIKNKID